ncbi:prolipoprotein diacylglyceryl transferase family protein [Aliidiomarina sp. Khilg15.8]
MPLSFGPFPTASLIFIVSAVLAMVVAWLAGRRKNGVAADAVFRIIAVGLISARLLFVIIYYENYWSAPWQIFNIRDGGFNLWAGLVVGLLWAIFEWRRLPAARIAIASGLASGTLVAVVLTAFLQTSQNNTEFPVTSLQNLDGETVQINQAFANQPVVINLWATWCPPCVREMPLLEEAADAWPDIAFLAVNQGESAEQVRQFLAQQGLNLPHVLLDERTAVGDAMASYVLPTTLFFHADGTLSDTHIGEFNAATLQNKLQRLK